MLSYFKSFVISAFLFLLSSPVWAHTIDSIRIQNEASRTRVVLDMSGNTKYSYFNLSNPDRLVVDVHESTLKAKLPMTFTDNRHLIKIRTSQAPNKAHTRLVLELTAKSEVAISKLSPSGSKGHRIVVDLLGEGKQPSSSSSNASQTVPTTTVKPLTKVVVAIDAGHGGEDPGSVGPTRKYEKHVNLIIARKIAERLNRTSNIKAILTRDKDEFLNLNARSRIARKNNAMLLLSIHADSFTSPGPRGGSVFVLSTRRANTEIARWVVKKEEQSQLLGGGGTVLANADDKNVSQTVLDLQFSYSQTEGNKLATQVLKEMGKVTRLHSSKPIYASLAVLKSPDIPSILIETGFISNPTEEKLLFTASHQNKLADSISKAVQSYFRENPPEGMIMVNHGGEQTHKVKKGEFLSGIARQYGTTTKNLMTWNNLKDANIKVGQTLKVSSGKISATSTTKTITYKVKSGDYLGKIADQHGVTISSIREANNLSDNTLKVGQTLTIPSAK